MMYASALIPFRPDDVPAQIAEAIRLRPSDARLLGRAASMMFHQRQMDRAREYGQRAAALAPNDLPLAREMANILGKIAGIAGDLGLAEEALRAAAADGDSDADYTYDLANFLTQTGRKAEALELLDASLGLVSGSTDLADLGRYLRS